MKAIEFESAVIDGRISVPQDVAGAIPPGEPLRVMVMWPSDGDTGWLAVSQRNFEDGYAPEDEVYERLLDDSQIR